MLSRDHNLNRFELGICIIIMVLMIGWLLQRIDEFEARAEKTALQTTLSQITYQLRMYKATHILLGDLAQKARLATQDPVGEIIIPPGKYIHDFAPSARAQVPPGHWYFDPDTHLLIYRVQKEAYIDTELTDPKQIRFRFRVKYHDMDGDGAFDAKHDKFITLTFEILDQYSWHLPGAETD